MDVIKFLLKSIIGLCAILFPLRMTIAQQNIAVVTTSAAPVQALAFVNGGQYASWSFSASSSTGNTNGVYYVAWSVDGNTIVDKQLGQTFTWATTIPGLHHIGAAFNGGGNGYDWGYKSVAAIGGPLSLSWIMGSSSNTPHHDDNLPANAVYLQYFYPAAHILAAYDEVAQKGSVNAEAQPPSVLVSYSLPSNVVPNQTDVNIPPTTVVTAIPASQGIGAVTATFTMNYLDPATNQTLSGSGNDDTAASGYSHEFHCHEPGSTFLVTGDPDYPQNPIPYYTPQGSHSPPDPGGCWGGGLYLYGLLDNEGIRMPGVWVQEDFGPGKSPSLQTNQDGTGWETIFGNIAFDTGGATNGAAYFDNYDQITAAWFSSAYPWTGDSFSCQHYYYAATLATGFVGIEVGDYTLTMDTGGLSNSPPANVNQG